MQTLQKEFSNNDMQTDLFIPPVDTSTIALNVQKEMKDAEVETYYNHLDT
jgi:hypothetical protein